MNIAEMLLGAVIGTVFSIVVTVLWEYSKNHVSIKLRKTSIVIKSFKNIRDYRFQLYTSRYDFEKGFADANLQKILSGSNNVPDTTSNSYAVETRYEKDLLTTYTKKTRGLRTTFEIDLTRIFDSNLLEYISKKDYIYITLYKEAEYIDRKLGSVTL